MSATDRMRREVTMPTAEFERVRLPIRRATGATATVILQPIGADRYAIATSTTAPGHGGRSSVVELAQTYPSRRAAIDAGAIRIRDYWRRRGVSALVADLDEFLDQWE